MAMKASAKRTAIFLYPVELVWKAIGGGEQRTVDPLTEEEFENKAPEPGMVYTKLTDLVQNEVFAIHMKTTVFDSDMRIELTELGPCKTQMRVQQSVEYHKAAAWALSRFGMGLSRDVMTFIQEIEKRLKDSVK